MTSFFQRATACDHNIWLIGHNKVSPSAKDGEVEQRERERESKAATSFRRRAAAAAWAENGH